MNRKKKEVAARVERHDLWKKTAGAQGEKLCQENLSCIESDFSGLDLSDAEIPGADFTGAKLTDINFTGCNLASADSQFASLLNASFNKANLCKSRLIQVDATGADFRGADLTSSNLSGSSAFLITSRGIRPTRYKYSGNKFITVSTKTAEGFADL